MENKKLKSDVNYVIIACCTYKRTQLLGRAIESFTHLVFPKAIKTEILIVDNDVNQSAKSVVNKYKENSPVEILYTVEKTPGLANVRNKALSEALEKGASHIAFIDDDEVADENWLVNHVIFYNENPDIYISSGPTYKTFEKDFPKYITNNNLFRATTKKTGYIKQTCASGNVFFPLNIVKDTRFSEKFNFLGGEDTDFFSRLSKSGFKIGQNNNAINYETLDEKRANVKWILARNFYNGYSVSFAKFYQNNDCVKRSIYIFEKLILTFIDIFISFCSIFLGRTCFFNVLGFTFKNAGKLIGAIRLKPINYY